jgi:hypothetical protein
LSEELDYDLTVPEDLERFRAAAYRYGDEGEPGHSKMMAYARGLFEEHQTGGSVVLKYDTQVSFGPLSDV